MKNLIIVAALFIVGCSSKTPRTVWTDPVMRVMVDPDSIDTANYVRITNALIKNGKFRVIDRGQGYMAARKEQDRLHREKLNRFDDKEKFALWAKMYGVGGIVTAHSQCQRASGVFKGYYLKCLNSLAIKDTEQLLEYKDIAKEEALRARELISATEGK